LKHGCVCLFVVTIDMRRIVVIINSYLNLKTYSITFINCLDRIVLWKLDKVWESWKRSKVSWMGHGSWMEIAWGNMGDGWMGLKHSSWNNTCFGGICFGGLGYSSIKMCVGLLAKTWHVSLGGKFWGSCFVTRDFDQPKRMSSRHWNTTCFHVDLLWGLCYLCVETHVEPPWSERCFYDLSLK